MATRCSTICLPISKDDYLSLIASPELFRRWIDTSFRDFPELFPEGFDQGFTSKDSRASKKLGIIQRRIRCKATDEVLTIRPSFVMPYMAGFTDEVEGPLFLRSFGVPFWALARVFGRDPMYWYRLELSLGRNSIVGTTIRRAEVPENLVADEHHRRRDGEKNYIATTVGEGCCLGSALSQSADSVGLKEAYGVFKQEAQDVEPDYEPRTVNTDGWAATKAAWSALFPLVVVLRCFLHGWLSIRDRGKHLKEVFRVLSKKVWHAYHAKDRRSFAQRLRRTREWARKHVKAAYVLEKVERLCGRSQEYGRSYEHPDGHRTSTMLDRVMRVMNRYFDRCQHLHGSRDACDQHARAWALLYNFRPWHPATTRANDGWTSPAERLNRHRYHDNWLHNLLVSASLGGYRRRITGPPPNP
jgi:hypothetical protein